MKRRAFLETALKKYGLTAEQAKEFIEKLEDEYDDNEAAKVLASLMTADEAKGNDDIFKDVKKRVKAEALDPIDNMLKTYESKLSDAQKTEYAKFGPNDSHKKYLFILKAFDEAGTKTGDKNYDDLKGEYDALKGQLGTDYIKKTDHDTVLGRLSQRETELTNVQLLNKAVRSGKLRDTSGDRHFERNFISDAHDLITQVGIGDKKLKGVIGADGKIMRADSPEQPLLLDGKAVDLAMLADLTITAYDYGKKSDPTSKDTVKIPTGADKATTKNSALDAMIAEEIAANK
ncbi:MULTISPECIES: hypothetical protein [unclassified Spirosoma]|uniref:hypothetical protein n=1 Tax=unclassified Spirosoma TaxID=2621999 RepID=UPI000967AB5E|nr:MULTISPECIES: hypothetical protein [unclassified Spirosoma]MBN8824443.1 hypothetical protein [Spirosoma sp.]OJW70094.1 MAG: hypothetical protein BGO59_25810 [Spirosoma sp. 48-14]